MTIAEGFSIFGSLASAGAILLGLWTFHKERKEYLQEKEDDKKLQIDSMNRLLAHRAVPLCQMAWFLCEIQAVFLTRPPKGTHFYYKINTKSIRLEYPQPNSKNIEMLSFDIPKDYKYLSDAILHSCAILSNKENELLSTGIAINTGGDCLVKMINAMCIHAKSKRLDRLSVFFGKQKNGDLGILAILDIVIKPLKSLEPEIQHFAVYNNVIAAMESLTKEFEKH